MPQRKVIGTVSAMREDIADLVTYRAMPTLDLQMIDPFLFLNHHGYQIYPKNNHGLPFGPHPHRGFETVTFVLEGDIAHKDSKGHASIIRAGGVQWMTAGSGIVHSEESSDEFKENGGPLEILQLWVNLPARLKMAAPKYEGKQKEEIPVIRKNGSVEIQLVSGNFDGKEGAFHSLTGIRTLVIHLQGKVTLTLDEDPHRNIFFYVIKGDVEVNQKTARARQTVRFDNSGEEITINSYSNAVILLCSGEPIKEPVYSYGPFVMNSEKEIEEAIQDYKSGKFQ